jgi:inorganic pyrophosphatase
MIDKFVRLDKDSSIKIQVTSLKVQMVRNIFVVFFLFSTLCLLECNPMTQKEAKPDSIPSTTFNEDGSVNVYIEIPAGTNVKKEIHEEDSTIKPDQINGQDRIIDFLPYPGNYGFIAGTMMDEELGGDGDALDVLVLCDARKSGTAMKVKPIGVLLLEDGGEQDHKVIAVPFEESERTIKVDRFSSFITKYNAAQFIVQEWFLNYKGLGQMRLLGWKDEEFAQKEIRKWSQDQKK